MDPGHITTDSRAVILLCSSVGSPDTGELFDLRPLTPKEWNGLDHKIHGSALGTPGALFGLTAAQLVRDLDLRLEAADRIQKLLERGGRAAIELERYASRGIWVLTQLDPLYPGRLTERLKHSAPPVLFGAGEVSLLSKGGIAVVGSRDIDEVGKRFAQEIGRKCARTRLPVISGGARGTDALAMGSAIEAGGSAVGVLADSLERTIRMPDVRASLAEGQLLLISQYSPGTRFSVGAAMARNRVIYALTDFAVVVSSDFEKGGTWAGAVEASRGGWCPVFVRSGEATPRGNQELLKKGALPLPESGLDAVEDLCEWMAGHSVPKPEQLELRIEERPQPYEPAPNRPEHEQAGHVEPQTRSATASEPAPVDRYELVWPRLEEYLEEPRTVDEIKAKFGLERSQVVSWLKRARAEKRVVKKSRPGRYLRVR